MTTDNKIERVQKKFELYSQTNWMETEWKICFVDENSNYETQKQEKENRNAWQFIAVVAVENSTSMTFALVARKLRRQEKTSTAKVPTLMMKKTQSLKCHKTNDNNHKSQPNKKEEKPNENEWE